MFFGQVVRTCDKNNHLATPVNLGSPLIDSIVVTQGFDRNLLVMPVDVFENLSRLVAGLNIADPLTRRLQRMLIGNAVYCEIDREGVFVLPHALKAMAGITSEVVWVGQGKYLEIWSGEFWHQQELELLDIASNTQRFASLSITGF